MCVDWGYIPRREGIDNTRLYKWMAIEEEEMLKGHERCQCDDCINHRNDVEIYKEELKNE